MELSRKVTNKRQKCAELQKKASNPGEYGINFNSQTMTGVIAFCDKHLLNKNFLAVFLVKIVMLLSTYLISPLATDCTCFTGGTLPVDLTNPLGQCC